MAIDPVILIMERIRKAESDLRVESRLNALNYSHARADLVNATLMRIRTLYDELTQTVPTSSLGAAELIRIAAHRLPFSHARYAGHLERVAERLGAGRRIHNDLVWLRAMADALKAGVPDDRNDRTAAILALAIRGAAQPVLIHRALVAQRGAPPRLDQLAAPP
ncbi:MAG TPA: hypothetical protein VGC16_03520 [Rhizomicrobium sp.]